jgi:hypothetical protein
MGDDFRTLTFLEDNELVEMPKLAGPGALGNAPATNTNSISKNTRPSNHAPLPIPARPWLS